MCMAVQENIAGAERRQVRGVVDVAVRGVDQPVSNREDAVISQNREGCTDFTGIFGEFATSQRADVGIGPYKTSVNSYCSASFERKANLPQLF